MLMAPPSTVVPVKRRAGFTHDEGDSVTAQPTREVADTVDITALWHSHHLAMVRLARLMVDDLQTAEDVVSDAYLALHRKGGNLRDPGAAVGYLRISVVNGARSTLRRRRTARGFLRAAEPKIAPPADEAVMIDDEHQAVWRAVQKLPPRQREVIVLRYWSDLSIDQIAHTLDISPGTVKSQASRAMSVIAATLRGEQE